MEMSVSLKYTEEEVDEAVEDTKVNMSTTIQHGALSAFVICFILGIGNLLPWNAFITASTYYQNRFCGTTYENSFESFFSMFYTVSQPVGLLATIYFKRHFTTKALVLYPLITYTVIFVVNTILVLLTTFPQSGLFSLTLISTFLCGLCSAVMNGGMFGLAGILPPSYTAALMSGQGLAGTLVSAVNLLIASISTKSHCSNDNDDNDGSSNTSGNDMCTNVHKLNSGALAYFVVATATLAFCVCLFRRLLLLPYVKHHMRLHLHDHLLENDTTGLNPMHSNAAHPSSNDNNLSTVETALTGAMLNADIVMSLNLDETETARGDSGTAAKSTRNAADISNESHNTRPVTTTEILQLLRKIWVPALSVFLVFMGTLSVFPSIMVLIVPENPCASSALYSDNLWVPFLFLLLNLFDFLGRVVAPIVKQHPFVGHWCTPEFVLATAIGRLLISVFFCLSNIDNNHLPIVTRNDGVTWLLTILLGFTNGLVANIAMMQGPSVAIADAENSEDNNTANMSSKDKLGATASLAGTIMIFCLSSGLLAGACLSFLLVYLVLGR